MTDSPSLRTLITGASSGLGAEMARQLAARGHDVAVTARRTDRLVALKAEIETKHPGRRVIVKALDVTDHEQVFAVTREVVGELGGLDRFIVNAGLGKGAALGSGKFEANRETAMTNFVGALAQMEAAMEVFREQKRGHLVVVSSISALRGMRRAMTTYGASKAGVASLAEGIRSEVLGKPGLDIDVTVLYPGYIKSEMNEHVEQETRFMVDTEVGVRAMVEAIEARKVKAYVPQWPWVPISGAMKTLPLSVVRRMV